MDIAIKVPDEIKIKKDSVQDINLIITNYSKTTINIDKIQTSCQCINISKKEFRIKTNDIDTLKLRLHGSIIGKNKEAIILTNNDKFMFKQIYLEYEVIE